MSKEQKENSCSAKIEVEKEKNGVEQNVSRRTFLGRTGKLIALGALANFALVGSAHAGKLISREIQPCTEPAQPWHVPGMCDAVNPDCTKLPYNPE